MNNRKAVVIIFDDGLQRCDPCAPGGALKSNKHKGKKLVVSSEVSNVGPFGSVRLMGSC